VIEPTTAVVGIARRQRHAPHLLGLSGQPPVAVVGEGEAAAGIADARQMALSVGAGVIAVGGRNGVAGSGPRLPA
jgi:hypothetical protein